MVLQTTAMTTSAKVALFGAPWQNRTAVTWLQNRCNTIILIGLIKRDTFLRRLFKPLLYHWAIYAWSVELESNQRVINDVAASIPKLVEPQGFEPRLRPYEWNEVVAVCILVRINFLRVLSITPRLHKLLVDCSRVELPPCLSYKHLLTIYTVTAHKINRIELN